MLFQVFFLTPYVPPKIHHHKEPPQGGEPPPGQGQRRLQAAETVLQTAGVGPQVGDIPVPSSGDYPVVGGGGRPPLPLQHMGGYYGLH